MMSLSTFGFAPVIEIDWIDVIIILESMPVKMTYFKKYMPYFKMN
jgi:hypothetical protein